MIQKKGSAENGVRAVPAWGLLSLEQQAVLSLKDLWQVMAFRGEKEQSEPLILALSLPQGSKEAELFHNLIFPKHTSTLKEVCMDTWGKFSYT